MNNLHTCNHIQKSQYILKENPYFHTYALNRDPTRTTTLRAMFVRDLTKRFAKLRGIIRKAIIDEDCFGLKKENDYGLVFHQQMDTPGKKAFNFPRSQDKVQAFMEWLKEQIDNGILEVVSLPDQLPGEAIDQAWTNLYIKKSYESGIIQARSNLKKAGYHIPDFEDIYEPSLPFPEIDRYETDYVFKDTLHMDRVGLLYTRTYNDLKGITNVMDGHISRVLAQGMAEGKHPYQLARLLTKVISGPVGDLGFTSILGRFIPAEKRARMLARTEIIRSHASATIQEYRRLQIEGIKIKAEWSTAGGACEECSAREARNPYTLNEIDGQIPFHPNCRCAILPLV